MSDNHDVTKKSRRPYWTRTVDIMLRGCHIGTTSVLFGGAVCGVPIAEIFTYHGLSIATGVGLILSEVYHSRHWLYQGRGIMALIHVGLLALVHFRPDLIVQILIVVLAFGVVGSHMPKKLRYWSFVHGRVMD
jgi:hypothetical protein